MLQKLLESLLEIEIKLENLSREFSDLYKEYSGVDFLEQKELAENFLDNLILATTHEVATEIGFYRHDILELTNFIKFRLAYKEISDDELLEIIDNDFINADFKLKLQKRITKNISIYINEIKNSWNKQFKNTSYSKIQKKYLNKKGAQQDI
jgi:hypothetical protein